MLRTTLLTAAALGLLTAAPALAQDPPAPNGTAAAAPPGLNAPNGQPASTVTTTASPPVHNPTDGQVDGPEVDQNAPDTYDGDASVSPTGQVTPPGSTADAATAAPPSNNPRDGQTDGLPPPARATPPVAAESDPADEDENTQDAEAPAPQ